MSPSTMVRRRSGLYVPQAAAGGYSAAVLADTPSAYFRLNDAFASISTWAASSTHFSSDPSRAFNANTADGWVSNGSSTGWLYAQLTSAIALSSYSVVGADTSFTARSPKNWTLEGSNNGSTWTTLDTQTNQVFTASEQKNYTYTNTTAYLYYRINVSANNGDTYLQINEFLVAPSLVDASGNSRANQPFGSMTPQSTGLVTGDTDKAVVFAGGNITLAYGSYMRMSTICLEAIIKFTTTGAYKEIWDRDDGVSRFWQFRVNTSQNLEFIWWTTTAGPFSVTGSTALSVNTKYHVAATYDGSAGKVWLNGVQDGSTTQAGTLQGASSGSSGIKIGVSSGGGFAFAGTIDEPAMYTSLSSTRIAAHAALA